MAASAPRGGESEEREVSQPSGSDSGAEFDAAPPFRHVEKVEGLETVPFQDSGWRTGRHGGPIRSPATRSACAPRAMWATTIGSRYSTRNAERITSPAGRWKAEIRRAMSLREEQCFGRDCEGGQGQQGTIP